MGIGKIDLAAAETLAQDIITLVTPAMDRVEVAGSIRRRKPVVGDIEIVGIPADRERLIKLLSCTGMHIKPGVPGVVQWTPKSDAKYLRLHLSVGVNLDFFLGTPENWGGLFLMRTGSGVDANGNSFNGFTPGIFSRWKKVSGGGRMTGAQPTTVAGEQLPLREEGDFFDLLGMDFVPPVERLDRKVIKKYVKSETQGG